MERMVCDLLEGTQGSGPSFTYCLFCTDMEGELYEAVGVVKKCGHRHPGWLIIDGRLVRQLCRFIREQRVDLLHAHNHAPNLYCALASLLTGVPVVVTRHGRGYHTLRWRILARVLSWRSKAVVFVSEDAKRVAIATGSVTPKKAIVIHNGIDTRRFAPRETLDHRPETLDRGEEPLTPPLSRCTFVTLAGTTVDMKGKGSHDASPPLSGEDRGEGGFPGIKSNVYGLRSTVSMALRERLGIPPDAVVIGSVGRLSPEKNYPLLVRAFSRLVRAETLDHRPKTIDLSEALGGRTSCEPSSAHGSDKPFDLAQGRPRPPRERNASDKDRSIVYRLKSNVPLFLLLVGDGNDRARIEAEVDRLGIKDQCHITGMQPDVLPWLHAMDIFCLSSDTEGLSISLLEAGACGLPSVVTDVGGNREIVQDGVSGFVVTRGDEAALSDNIKGLAADAAVRRSMGAEARRRVVERFSLGAMADAYVNVYGKAMR